MHGATDVDWPAAVASEIHGADDARCYARTEQLAVPAGVIVTRDAAGILTSQHAIEARFHRVKGVVIAACGERVAVLAVVRFAVRVPDATAHPLDQVRAHSVALDRQRVIG